MALSPKTSVTSGIVNSKYLARAKIKLKTYFFMLESQNPIFFEKKPIDYFPTIKTTLKRTIIASSIASALFTLPPPLTEGIFDIFGTSRETKENLVRAENEYSAKVFFQYPAAYTIQHFFPNNDPFSFTSEAKVCAPVLKYASKKSINVAFTGYDTESNAIEAISAFLKQPGVCKDALTARVILSGEFDSALGKEWLNARNAKKQAILDSIKRRLGLANDLALEFKLDESSLSNNKKPIKDLVSQVKSMKVHVEVDGKSSGNPSGIYFIFIPIWKIFRRWRKNLKGAIMDKIDKITKKTQKPDKDGFFEPYAPDDYDKKAYDSMFSSILSERKKIFEFVSGKFGLDEAKKTILLMDIEDYYWAKYLVSPTLEVGKKILECQEKRVKDSFDKKTRERLIIHGGLERNEAIYSARSRFNPIYVEDAIPGGYNWQGEGMPLFKRHEVREIFWPDYLAMKVYCMKTYNGEP